MGKFILETVFIVVLGFAAQYFFPWWSIAIVAALAGMIFKFKNSFWAYLAGFTAVALLWGGYAVYLDAGNLQILSTKMGNLFGNISSTDMIYVTSLIGGLVGGLSAMTGNLGRNLFG